MIKSQFYSPSERCAPLVDRYIVMRNYESVELFADKYIPNGSAAMVFNFISDEKYITEQQKYSLPNHFLVVPNLISLKFESQSLFDTLIVRCKASVLSRLFKISLVRKTEYPHINVDLFNGYPMFEELSRIEDTEERIRFFEDYLTENICPADYIPDEIDFVYDTIINSDGNIKIGDLIETINMNPRSFRRCFLNRVGISAKELLRIVRVNYVWELCRKTPQIDFYNIVYECRFFDQSHFIKDFKKIIGETPRKFFTRELDQVNFISGRQN